MQVMIWSILLSICVSFTLIAVNSELITDETQGVNYLKDANDKIGQQLRKMTEIQWSYNTNITDATTEALLKSSEEFSKFQKQQLKETLKYDWSKFSESNKRQFEKLSVIGTGALDEEDIKTVIYSY